ncbi:MAG TPA: VWA domain-containing protein [Xanthomonadaceae bacterium]|nr:VWA domain-containing protein [Xanthomonadaceae bacterium]
MKTRLLIVLLFVLTAGIVLGLPERGQERPPQPQPQPLSQKPRIDAVFVLDTTGSMGGLIQAAKENIWSIASSMASAQPTPELRIGLVAFRDRGDEYVTRMFDLSTDLDAMYLELMGFQAGGGGDFPEAVNEALYDAVHRMSWTQDNSAYKVIFLVGDAPPQMNYPDDVKYPETLKVAGQRGIVVNTIQAGDNGATRAAWQQIASLGNGASFKVGMQGDAIAVATPFDEEIARISREMDDTRLFYGSAETQAAMARKAEAGAELDRITTTGARVKRALFNASPAGRDNFLAGADLVDDISSGRVDIDAIDEALLPAPVAAMEPEARREAVEQAANRRAELQARLGELAAKRSLHVEAELRSRDDVEESLDRQLFEVVKAQAASKGLSYEGKEVH